MLGIKYKKNQAKRIVCDMRVSAIRGVVRGWLKIFKRVRKCFGGRLKGYKRMSEKKKNVSAEKIGCWPRRML